MRLGCLVSPLHLFHIALEFLVRTISPKKKKAYSLEKKKRKLFLFSDNIYLENPKKSTIKLLEQMK